MKIVLNLLNKGTDFSFLFVYKQPDSYEKPYSVRVSIFKVHIYFKIFIILPLKYFPLSVHHFIGLIKMKFETVKLCNRKGQWHEKYS